MKKFFILTLFLTTLLAVQICLAQEPLKPRPSPLEMVTFKYDDTYVKLTYSRPHKKGREIFGSLVPYGEVWRTGANEATEITTTKDIRISGNDVPAGTYTIFSIPQRDKWTIILNSDLGQWGSFNYNKEKDFLRFDVPAQNIQTVYEPFTIEFEQEANNANLVIMWDKTKVSLPIEFK